MWRISGILLVALTIGCSPSTKKATQDNPDLFVKMDADSTLSVFRKSEEKPILVQNAKSDFRPYIHPIVAPDGKGVLTEYSPSHHKHQTGLYWGFTRVNDR
ncbi:MAG: DUF6807 family protein, partial [Cyclobacteriaceae bacterium]